MPRLPFATRRLAGALLFLAMGGIAPGAAAQPAPVRFIALVGQADARSDARDWAAAIPLWREVVRQNPTDGRYWGRLSAALMATHDYRGAIPALEQAVALGDDEPENSAYNIACAYARLGDRDRAFAWLERALALRFLNLDLALRDPDLASLRSDPRFARLIPLARSVAGMSRAQGWRHDMEVLLWQIDRLGAAPYRLHPRAWFEQRLRALAAAASHRTDLQLAIDLAVILRGLGDGHSGMMAGATADWALSLPLQFSAFPEGVFITAAAPQHRRLLGAQVLSIGSHPIDAVMRGLEAGVSRDNESGWVRVQAALRLRYTALLQAGGVGDAPDRATLGLRLLDGSQEQVSVAADTSQPDIWNRKPAPAGWTTLDQALPGDAPLYLRDPGRNYWFQHLPAERTVYWGFNTLRNQGDETLAAFARRLMAFVEANRVERLVIDLRWNNGGNETLMTPVIAELLRSERISRRGHLIVLIGPRTFSAAQSAAAMLERYTAAVFVGEPTGSSPNFVGEEDPFTLPYSRLTVNVSHLYHQNGIPQDRRSWIAPLIYAPVTFADYRAKRDPAMAAVLAMPVGE